MITLISLYKGIRQEKGRRERLLQGEIDIGLSVMLPRGKQEQKLP